MKEALFNGLSRIRRGKKIENPPKTRGIGRYSISNTDIIYPSISKNNHKNNRR